MTASAIHVVAYDDLRSALSDWDELDAACGCGQVELVDAVLVEADGQVIRTVHRFSTRSAARGSASVSVVGLLQPPSLVSGPLAGGIGERTIATLAGGLDRVRIKQLGDTMDLGPFTIVLIAGELEQDRADGCVPAGRAWCGAIASIAVATTASTESIDRAVRFDDPLR